MGYSVRFSVGNDHARGPPEPPFAFIPLILLAFPYWASVPSCTPSLASSPPGKLRGRLRSSRVDSGVQFLCLLDDKPDTRSHVIFLTHGALNRAIGDGLAKLAVIKRAFKGRSSLAAQRTNFQRFAGKLLGLDSSFEKRAPGLLGDLLDRPYESWFKTIQRANERLKEKFTDDPVPRHLAEVLEQMSSEDKELTDLVEELRFLPLRESANIGERLTNVRRALNAAMDKVWKLALRRASFRSPLLILDEAHHVKNPATRLASLFA
jgi:hypothetical protein